MNDEHGHIAMPKLYGAPAYARPPTSPAKPVERPFDPDDLPIESEQTTDDRVPGEQVAPEPDGSGSVAGEPTNGHDGASRSGGRPFRIRLPRIGRPGP